MGGRLRKTNVTKYMRQRCTKNGSNGFWKTVKPLFSDKGPCHNETITLIETEKLVSEAMSVVDVLNEPYVSLTKGVGKPGRLTCAR